MDYDDSFTRELEDPTNITFDGSPGDALADDILDLDIEDGDVKKEGDNQQGGKFVSSVADEEAREAALIRERDAVARINSAIETIIHSLEKAQEGQEKLQESVDNANALMDRYIAILSQSTHASQLILNGRWRGATADLKDIEEENLMAQMEAERRQRAEEEAAREREREARAREAAAVAAAARGAPRGGRATSTGRRTPGVRSVSAGSGAYGGSYNSQGVAVGGSSSTGAPRGLVRGSGMSRYSTAGRSGSGIGRGIARGTGRGTRG